MAGSGTGGYDIGASLAASSTATSGVDTTNNTGGTVTNGLSTSQLLLLVGGILAAVFVAFLLFGRKR